MYTSMVQQGAKRFLVGAREADADYLELTRCLMLGGARHPGWPSHFYQEVMGTKLGRLDWSPDAGFSLRSLSVSICSSRPPRPRHYGLPNGNRHPSGDTRSPSRHICAEAPVAAWSGCEWPP